MKSIGKNFIFRFKLVITIHIKGKIKNNDNIPKIRWRKILNINQSFLSKNLILRRVKIKINNKNITEIAEA